MAFTPAWLSRADRARVYGAIPTWLSAQEQAQIVSAIDTLLLTHAYPSEPFTVQSVLPVLECVMAAALCHRERSPEDLHAAVNNLRGGLIVLADLHPYTPTPHWRASTTPMRRVASGCGNRRHFQGSL